MRDPMSRLPDLPSDLLTVALVDLAAAEQNPRYRINMGTWHVPEEDGRCMICLAGATMAGTLGMNPSKELDPSDAEVLEEGLGDKLKALDSLRTGELEEAMEILGMELPDHLAACHRIPRYEVDRTGFHRELTKLAGLMKSEGI
jgi:hypothetical protein